mmetsp:Transcript_10970/g.16126  ORF Transcript_10970/g.16126 Transcript_10970/m.16126 type:complete len:390 (+) Transcript_10970:240-1409(+)
MPLVFYKDYETVKFWRKMYQAGIAFRERIQNLTLCRTRSLPCSTFLDNSNNNNRKHSTECLTPLFNLNIMENTIIESQSSELFGTSKSRDGLYSPQDLPFIHLERDQQFADAIVKESNINAVVAESIYKYGGEQQQQKFQKKQQQQRQFKQTGELSVQLSVKFKKHPHEIPEEFFSTHIYPLKVQVHGGSLDVGQFLKVELHVIQDDTNKVLLNDAGLSVLSENVGVLTTEQRSTTLKIKVPSSLSTYKTKKCYRFKVVIEDVANAASVSYETPRVKFYSRTPNKKNYKKNKKEFKEYAEAFIEGYEGQKRKRSSHHEHFDGLEPPQKFLKVATSIPLDPSKSILDSYSKRFNSMLKKFEGTMEKLETLTEHEQELFLAYIKKRVNREV